MKKIKTNTNRNHKVFHHEKETETLLVTRFLLCFCSDCLSYLFLLSTNRKWNDDELRRLSIEIGAAPIDVPVHNIILKQKAKETNNTLFVFPTQTHTH